MVFIVRPVSMVMVYPFLGIAMNLLELAYYIEYFKKYFKYKSLNLEESHGLCEGEGSIIFFRIQFL